ncbi:hypothetical protein NA57DRAFT_55484 [Rhizodiscina lignyota]|uniref:GRF-type domain-containing protein n=1 Tax=Rhizodiscina lignyota TaxID=1504668 RepID=A0A9P4M719_9PEZI|nr:hypothetical protein NA57DRAFT_55484 [Rhizodiscina lignyota]
MYPKRGSWRGRGRGGGSSSVSAVRLKAGVFQDGTWLCNCNPRVPASRFKVKKEGRNQGRWFYTCQKSHEQCGFFLWEDDAKPREEAAVLSNSRNEPRASTSTIQRGDTRRASPPPPYTPIREAAHPGQDQADIETEGEEDDTYDWPANWGQQEQEQVERQLHDVSPPPATPRKPTASNAYATPVTGKRKISNVDDVEYPALSTSSTTSRHGGRTVEISPQSNASSRTLAGPSSYASPQSTPTPSRFKDAVSDQDSSFNLTSDVLGLLSDHNARLDSTAQASLKTLLNRSDLRVRGILKGRDVSRLQIKAKDAKIAEQQLRITTLEAELEAERAMVQHLNWEKQNGAQPD